MSAHTKASPLTKKEEQIEWILVPLCCDEGKKKFTEYIYKKTGKEITIRDQYKNGLVMFLVSTDLLKYSLTNITCGNSAKYKTSGVNEFIDWYENVFLVTHNLSIIKHIPHCSVKLPKGFLDSVICNHLSFQIYNYKMSDIGVDNLFEYIPGITLKAKYSRLFCDVERFKDNDKEPMAKIGQGYKYTKFYDGKDYFRFIKVNDFNWDKYVDDYYDEWHQQLNNTVSKEIDNGKHVLILDIHSYSDELANSLGNKGPYPDICIGINKDFNNEKLLNLIIKKIEEKGYSYKINFPYSGAIVPTGVINGSIKGKVDSIMIEVNKRIYL